jgi:nicotinate-nucleotide adenylyltransferase
LARLAVAARPGTDPVDALAALPETWRERVDFVTMTPVDLASTDLRQRVASGRSIRYLVPPSVAEIIDVNDLYKQPEIPL